MSTIDRLAALACIATILAAFVCPGTIARADAVRGYTGAVMTDVATGDTAPGFIYINGPAKRWRGF
jgi:hypothetical protein